jgi:hypothetical protein
MDYSTTDVLCTKHRLWKKGTLVQSIIDQLLEHGYAFKDVVIGEPNNFIFADQYDEIEDLFKKRGFYGIRIKMIYEDVSLEINSNTDGVNNVQYTIFATNEETYKKVLNDLDLVREWIGPSSEGLANVSEYLVTHKRLTYGIIVALIGTILYFLGAYVFLFSAVRYILSFSPFLVMYFVYLFFLRRRR